MLYNIGYTSYRIDSSDFRSGYFIDVNEKSSFIPTYDDTDVKVEAAVVYPHDLRGCVLDWLHFVLRYYLATRVNRSLLSHLPLRTISHHKGGDWNNKGTDNV